MDPMNRDSPTGRSSDRTASRRRLSTVLMVSMLVSWLLTLAPLPYSLLSGLTALVALVLLLVLIVRSVRERRYAMAVLGTLLGVPALLLIVASAALSGVFYGPMAQHEQCRATALTEQARVECDTAVQGSMVEWVSGLFGG